MNNILYITSRFPYPPVRGDQLILYNRIKILSKRYNITLLTLYENENQLKNLKNLEPFCKKVICIKLTKIKSFLNILIYGFFTKLPLQVIYFKSGKFKRQIETLLQNDSFDIIHVYTLRMAEYVKNLKKSKVLDLIDSMQLNLVRRVQSEKYLNKILFREELMRIRRYENEIIRRYDATIVVSNIDKDKICCEQILVVPNGVDINQYKRYISLPLNNTIIFSGNMSYFSNQHAVKWFLKNCFQEIKRKIADVKFVIVGTSPSKSIKDISDGNSIIVKGYVESMTDELNNAQIAIVPMQSGSGIQNKVLEAMACELPVVCTTLGRGDIKAVDKKHLIIADNPAEFSNTCIMLLKDHELAQTIGKQARKFVENNYSWEMNVNKIEEIYESIIEDKKGTV